MASVNKTQTSFSGGIVSEELLGRIDFEKLATGAKQLENFEVRPIGGIQYATGTEFIRELQQETRLIPFYENEERNYVLLFEDSKIIVFKQGFEEEIVTPYLSSELSLIKYAQHRNQLFLTHENHTPRVLEIDSETQDIVFRELKFNTSLVLTDFVPDFSIESGTYIGDVNKKLDYDKWQYAISIEDEDGNESLPIYSNLLTNDISLSQQPIIVNIGLISENPVGLKKINLFRTRGGDFFFVQSFTDFSQEDLQVEDAGLILDETKAVKEPFTDFESDNPRTVNFFNQRLIFGGTKKKPNDIWGSNVGKYEDFTNTINLGSSEAFNLTLASSTSDEIKNQLTLDVLVLFTTDKIWKVSGTSAFNMLADIESYTSVSDLIPKATKKSILYLDGSLNSVQNFVYSYELNGFVGQGLDLLARDLFDGYTFVAQSFRSNPFPFFYVIRDDGVLLILTYLREENVYAWTKHTTQGEYKDVCVLSTPVNDTIYFKVKRGNKYYLEKKENQINLREDVNDSNFLHCAEKITDNTSDTITIERFANTVVDVVAEKNVFKDISVDENGSFTIDGLSSFNRVVVGYSYRGVVQTIPFEMLGQNGSSSLGLNRKINNVTLTYNRSRGIKYGTDISKLTEIKPYPVSYFAEDIPLESGRFNLPITSSWNTETTLFVVQDYPLPLFLQNVTLEISYGNKN